MTTSLPPTKPSARPPSLLEQLGTLNSDVLHEIVNLNSVIAGALTLMRGSAASDPRTAAASAALRKASQGAGDLVEEIKNYRKSLRNRAGVSSVREIVRLLQEFLGPGGWSVAALAAPSGFVMAEPKWVAFAVQAAMAATRSARGELRIEVQPWSSRNRPPFPLPPALPGRLLVRMEIIPAEGWVAGRDLLPAGGGTHLRIAVGALRFWSCWIESSSESGVSLPRTICLPGGETPEAAMALAS